jgi:hypothetical protein
MNEDNESLFDNLKFHFDKLVDTNVTLDTLGINVDAFKDEARDILMSKIHDMASERLENTEIE